MKKRMLFLFLFFCSSVFLNAEQGLVIRNPAATAADTEQNSISPQNNQQLVIQKKQQKVKTDQSVLNDDNGVQTKGASRLIAKLTVTKTSPKQIIKVKKQMEEIQKSLVAQPQPVGINKTIKFVKGQEVTIHIKAGFTTIVNIVDDAGNPVRFTYLTIGNNFIKVTQFGNKLEIKPLRTYSVTNLIVGVEGYDYPVTLNIQEVGDADTFDNYVNLILSGSFQSKVGSDDIKMKSAILQSVFKYGDISSLPKIDYEVYSLKTKKPVLFSKNVLKIYKVEKFGKTYYLVLINKNFIMYGNKSFGTYNAKYNIYFLNFNQNVFTIRTNPKLKMPYPMVERYRVIIKDF